MLSAEDKNLDNLILDKDWYERHLKHGSELDEALDKAYHTFCLHFESCFKEGIDPKIYEQKYAEFQSIMQQSLLKEKILDRIYFPQDYPEDKQNKNVHRRVYDRARGLISWKNPEEDALSDFGRTLYRKKIEAILLAHFAATKKEWNTENLGQLIATLSSQAQTSVLDTVETSKIKKTSWQTALLQAFASLLAITACVALFSLCFPGSISAFLILTLILPGLLGAFNVSIGEYGFGELEIQIIQQQATTPVTLNTESAPSKLNSQVLLFAGLMCLIAMAAIIILFIIFPPASLLVLVPSTLAFAAITVNATVMLLHLFMLACGFIAAYYALENKVFTRDITAPGACTSVDAVCLNKDSKISKGVEITIFQH